MKDENAGTSAHSTPSPGTPGEGRGEGLAAPRSEVVAYATAQTPSVESAADYQVTSRSLLLLAIILALGASLRIARINYGSLMFDEQWHLELSTGRGSPHVRVPENQFIPSAPAVTSLKDAPPWYAVWTNMDYVVHPPLYCQILRLWRDLFGEGDIAARAYSVVCSLVAITFLYFAALRLNGLTTAFWAALIWAAAPTQVLIAEQVRGYDQLAAFGIGALWCLVEVERHEKPSRWIAAMLGLCVLGMMLSHYFAIGACAAMACYTLIRFRKRKLAMVWVAFGSAAIVFLITWGPFLLKQRTFFAETADSWLIEPGPEHLPYTLGRLASWCWWLVVRDTGATPWGMLSGIVLIVPLVLILIGKRKDLLLWFVWLLGTLGFVACLDLFRSTSHLRFERYISLASPAVFVLFAGMVSRLPLMVKHILPGAVVIAALFNSGLAYTTLDEPDWRPLGAKLDERAAPGETFIFYPGAQARWYIEIFYLGAAHYSHGFPRPIVKLTKPASPALVAQVPGTTAWLISGQLDRPIDQIVPGATLIEQYPFQDLAVATRVRLPQ